VLVIVDAQREYVDGALPLVGVDAAIAETAQLLARARKSGTPIIYVVHKGAGAVFNPTRSGFEIVAALRPLPGEAVVEKMRVSAFAGTKLEELIRQTGRKNLVIVGFMTHNCVSSTARAARDLGYAPTVVAAATATRDLPDGRNGVIAASVLQASSLAALADRTATVIPAQRDISD
jgi:nicotinamidase-related amidase